MFTDERERERERERETLMREKLQSACGMHPDRGLNSQPRYVP